MGRRQSDVFIAGIAVCSWQRATGEAPIGLTAMLEGKMSARDRIGSRHEDFQFRDDTALLGSISKYLTEAGFHSTNSARWPVISTIESQARQNEPPERPLAPIPTRMAIKTTIPIADFFTQEPPSRTVFSELQSCVIRDVNLQRVRIAGNLPMRL